MFKLIQRTSTNSSNNKCSFPECFSLQIEFICGVQFKQSSRKRHQHFQNIHPEETIKQSKFCLEFRRDSFCYFKCWVPIALSSETERRELYLIWTCQMSIIGLGFHVEFKYQYKKIPPYLSFLTNAHLFPKGATRWGQTGILKSLTNLPFF